MPRPLVVVAIGSGDHTDPWHDLAATGSALATLAAEQYETRIASTDDLTSISGADLVIVDVGGDPDADTVDSREAVDALLAAHTSGIPLLAVHSSVNAFRDDPRWAELLGGRWVRGVTHHPPIGDAVVAVLAEAPFGVPGELAVYDERYTALERRTDTVLVAEHDEDGTSHPLIWARDPATGGRVVYSALGHDVRSFGAPGHRRLLLEATRWLLAART